MIDGDLKNLPSVQLFKCCVSNYHDNVYWEEFTIRYNSTLTRGIHKGYALFGRSRHLSKETMADVMQDVYLEILKDGCATLERFKGQTEMEAQAFLARLAANITSNHLRRTIAQKRQGPVVSYDEITGTTGKTPEEIYTEDLADHELVRILQSKLSGEHKKRDILLFVLHIKHGLTITELASFGICNLKPSSIAQILRRIRTELKKTYAAAM